jgi:hypothetical protein
VVAAMVNAMATYLRRPCTCWREPLINPTHSRIPHMPAGNTGSYR